MEEADGMKSGPHRRATAPGGLWKGLNPGMAMAAKGVVLVFVLATVWDVEAAGTVFGRVRAWIEGTLDWFYVLTVCATLFTCLLLACSRFGRIRLGDEDAAPEFSRFSWLAMLFSAAVGIGLLFFSIAEPIFYFDNSQAAGYPNNPIADLAGAT
ncbi:MAG: BCCT family transporter, partial [Gemmatimonadales bacterium]|nr:BCCT family transporter [Gemmatimonadales bacterium]